METSDNQLDDKLNAYQAPDAELLDQNNLPQAPEFFPVSLKKLSIMYITTFGLYSVVWFYQNWKLQQTSIEKKINPVLRGIFSIFFAHTLFERVHKKTKEVSDSNWSSDSLANIYVIFAVLGNVSDRIIENIDSIKVYAPLGVFIYFITLYPVYQIQKHINTINKDPQGKLNNSFSGINIFFIILGALWWVLTFIGLYVLTTEGMH